MYVISHTIHNFSKIHENLRINQARPKKCMEIYAQIDDGRQIMRKFTIEFVIHVRLYVNFHAICKKKSKSYVNLHTQLHFCPICV